MIYISQPPSGGGGNGDNNSMLPKTGQLVSYRTGDDGDLEHGWTDGDRFVPQTIEGDDVVIDMATGLMWAADGDEAGCYNGGYLAWNDAIDYCNALDFAGFDDWFLPNVRQLSSIVCIQAALSGLLIEEPPFSNTVPSNYQSSTTCAHTNLRAHNVKFDYFAVQDALKTGEMFMRACRKV